MLLGGRPWPVVVDLPDALVDEGLRGIGRRSARPPYNIRCATLETAETIWSGLGIRTPCAEVTSGSPVEAPLHPLQRPARRPAHTSSDRVHHQIVQGGPVLRVAAGAEHPGGRSRTRAARPPAGPRGHRRAARATRRPSSTSPRPASARRRAGRARRGPRRRPRRRGGHAHPEFRGSGRASTRCVPPAPTGKAPPRNSTVSRCCVRVVGSEHLRRRAGPLPRCRRAPRAARAGRRGCGLAGRSRRQPRHRTLRRPGWGGVACGAAAARRRAPRGPAGPALHVVLGRGSAHRLHPREFLRIGVHGGDDAPSCR